MRGSDFIFASFQLCHIDSPDWIKNKKATINPKNEDDRCFQYVVTVALNYGDIESHPERVLNIKKFINKYNWKELNYPSKTDDWKTFEKNDLTLAGNILYIKEKEIYPAYFSKHNNPWKTNNFLNALKQRKRRMALFCSKKITSKDKSDFIAWICLHSFRTENKLKSHEKVCKNKNFVEL